MTPAAWAAIVSALAVALSAFGLVARLAFIHGAQSTLLKITIRELADLRVETGKVVDELRAMIGNGKPGVLVRHDSFQPVADEVERLRDRMELQVEQTLRRHELEVTMLRATVARLEGHP